MTKLVGISPAEEKALIKKNQEAFNKKKQKERENIAKQFDEQFDAFAKDDEFGEYDRFTPIGAKVLVKLFKFSPEDPGESLGKQAIVIPDASGNLKPQAVALHEKVFPIVKVIKKGIGDWGQSQVSKEDVQEGGLYIVPTNDVVGMKTNPEFLHMLQTYKGKQGSQGALIKVTDEMNIPQNLPKLDIVWERYKFSMPDRLGEETEDDKLVFLIPAQKLEAKYELTT